MVQKNNEMPAGRVFGRRANKRIVFIGAVGYSGSTLLGVMLGAHPLIFYAGEARKASYFDDPDAPIKDRVCRLCGPGCPVWGELRVAPGEDLYEMLARRTRRPIVFDSSKRVEWIRSQVAALRDVVPLWLIVLTRDGRAVLSSNLRKEPEISAHEYAATWVKNVRGVEELAVDWPGPVHRVRYEDLALRPEPTLRTLAEFLDVSFDPAMLDPWDSVHHPLGGNDGPLLILLRERRSSAVTGVINTDGKTCDWYGAHPRGIVLDLRWKHELSTDALAVFEEVAGEINRAYAWQEPAD
jgi:hypothetical protein